MNEPERKSWIVCAILTGVAYGVIGLFFPNPDATDPQNQLQWRLAAWVVSAVVFAFHIGYERFRLHSSPLNTALHTAIAVALGAFILALGATIRATTVVRQAPFSRYLLALVLWPIFTAVPAFIVAFLVAAILSKVPNKRFAE
jgi:uncharacterized membrane protein YczE